MCAFRNLKKILQYPMLFCICILIVMKKYFYCTTSNKFRVKNSGSFYFKLQVKFQICLCVLKILSLFFEHNGRTTGCAVKRHPFVTCSWVIWVHNLCSLGLFSRHLALETSQVVLMKCDSISKYLVHKRKVEFCQQKVR